MSTEVLTLDGLAVYAERRAAQAQQQLNLRYEAAIRTALTGLNVPGVAVQLSDNAGHSRSHTRGAQFFSCRGLSKPVLEEMTFELFVVLATDVTAETRWWQRLLHVWRKPPVPRRRLVRIVCRAGEKGTGQIWLDHHLLKTF